MVCSANRFRRTVLIRHLIVIIGHLVAEHLIFHPISCNQSQISCRRMMTHLSQSMRIEEYAVFGPRLSSYTIHILRKIFYRPTYVLCHHYGRIITRCYHHTFKNTFQGDLVAYLYAKIRFFHARRIGTNRC